MSRVTDAEQAVIAAAEAETDAEERYSAMATKENEWAKYGAANARRRAVAVLRAARKETPDGGA